LQKSYNMEQTDILMDKGYRPFRELPTGAHILVGFSGGVDSTVTALLALRSGYSVTGVRMTLFEEDSSESAEKAQSAADKIGIRLITVPLASRFRERVLRPSWETFQAGFTPNPCALCNPRVKFGALLPLIEEYGCDAFATGHYAKVFTENGKTVLARGEFRPKDQSYFLFGLSQEQLGKVVFPLGAMSKDEVRAIAAEAGMPNAKAKESQDACFMPPNQTAAGFLKDFFHAHPKPGPFRCHPDGHILGHHDGIYNFTIGQRKGTGVAMGVPAWISKIDGQDCSVWITTDSDVLLANGLKTDAMHWVAEPQAEIFHAQVQIRYRSRPVESEIHLQNDGTAEIKFETPIRAVTPGQAAVLYDGDRLIGGGQIRQAIQ